MSQVNIPPVATGRTPRDPRLDVWRGFAMLIIMVAHIPSNIWANYIPARFGPSDAAEMFVFCSGFAAAIAFGGTFARHGWWMGTRRIMFRCWQIYWAHIGLFLVIAMISVLSTWYVGEDIKNYMIELNILWFFEQTETMLVALLTFTWVPNYFDILPMYFVILLMVPLVVALQRIHTGVAIAFCLILYAATWFFRLGFPAEPWSERMWFFNPLGWQVLFFTGFMLSRGWIRPPPITWRIGIPCLIFILAMIPVSRWQIFIHYPVLESIHDTLWMKGAEPGGVFKTDEHPLRWMHLMAITYVAVWAVQGREHWLKRWPLTMVEKVGQQALATFMFSMALARVMGVVLDQWGRTQWTWAVVNIAGLASVIAVAYIVSWYKREPWRKPPVTQPHPVPSHLDAGTSRGTSQGAAPAAAAE
ncbi:MAG: OpgC domain-containing protein [Geminicoccaceae bacterium]|nr:OpgC domain-containing protein [Geminicoccaceae bacterium]MCB9943590.1 OpgC domain-containing protein [Geminicoccaceae bacterium]